MSIAMSVVLAGLIAAIIVAVYALKAKRKSGLKKHEKKVDPVDWEVVLRAGSDVNHFVKQWIEMHVGKVTGKADAIAKGYIDIARNVLKNGSMNLSGVMLLCNHKFFVAELIRSNDKLTADVVELFFSFSSLFPESYKEIDYDESVGSVSAFLRLPLNGMRGQLEKIIDTEKKMAQCIAEYSKLRNPNWFKRTWKSINTSYRTEVDNRIREIESIWVQYIKQWSEMRKLLPKYQTAFNAVVDEYMTKLFVYNISQQLIRLGISRNNTAMVTTAESIRKEVAAR